MDNASIDTAELARRNAEAVREGQEEARIEGESQRRAAETNRQTAEATRASREETRIREENRRQSAEMSRESAEQRRWEHDRRLSEMMSRETRLYDIEKRVLGHISCIVRDGSLYVEGADKFLRAGYVPYLFRYVKKRTKDYLHPGSDFHLIDGWSVYGNYHAVQMGGSGSIEFGRFQPQNPDRGPYTPGAPNVECAFEQIAHAPSEVDWFSDPAAFVSVQLRDDGKSFVKWGRKRIPLFNPKIEDRPAYRTITLKFGIGFGLPVELGRKRVRVCNLVTNLAEFNIMYCPWAVDESETELVYPHGDWKFCMA